MRNYLDKYLDELRSKNFADNTISSYSFQLAKFIDFAGDIRPSDITSELVEAYRSSLVATNHPNTVNYHLIALRNFLKFLNKKGVNSLFPEEIELGKVITPETTFLEDPEVDKLLSAVDVRTKTGKRDRAIIQTLLATGLRVSELVSLQTKQINFIEKSFTIRGKGGKLRIGFLTNPAESSIKVWLVSRTDTNPYLFVSNREHNPNKLTSRAVERIIKKYVLKAGIEKRVSPHTFRHTYATALLRKTNNIKVVGELLGHASLATTSRYTHLTNQDLRTAYFAANKPL